MPDIISLVCPSCGGNLGAADSSGRCVCSFCGREYIVKIEAARESGPAASLSQAQNDELRALVARGKKIEAIKRVRMLTEMDLKRAKDYVEAL